MSELLTPEEMQRVIYSIPVRAPGEDYSRLMEAVANAQLAKVRDRPDEYVAVSIGVLEALVNRLDVDEDLAEIKAIGYALIVLKHRDRPVCPKCGGVGYLPDDDTGEPNPPVGGIRCPVCEGTGEARRPDREKIAEEIYSDARRHMLTFPERHTPTWAELDDRRKSRYRTLADQISTLFDEEGIRKDEQKRIRDIIVQLAGENPLCTIHHFLRDEKVKLALKEGK